MAQRNVLFDQLRNRLQGRLSLALLLFPVIIISALTRQCLIGKSYTVALQQGHYDLNAEADDLGWIPAYSPTPPKTVQAYNFFSNSKSSLKPVKIHPARLHRPGLPSEYLVIGQNVKTDLAGVVNSLSNDLSGRMQTPSNAPPGQQALTSNQLRAVLKTLAEYAPLASQAQEDLNSALALRRKAARARLHARKESQLQYGREIQDEYDAASIYAPAPKDQYGAATQATLRIAPGDVPAIACANAVTTDGAPAAYAPKLDRLDDCELGPRRAYNRMYSLDRARANAPPAPPAAIRAHMAGVRRFVRTWRGLLDGDGGGDGPGAFDDAYYFCYDQYQEDPELEACLQDLADDGRKGPFAVHAWAASDGRGATHDAMGKEEERVGFPQLDREWKKELGPTDSGDWVRLKKEGALTADGSAWAPLAADNPAKGEVGKDHVAPFAADNLPSPVDGIVGGR